MRTFHHAVIPCLWLIWLAVWIGAAVQTKEIQRRESMRSHLLHHVPLTVGGVLLAWPGILGARLEQRFAPYSPPWFWITVALVAFGIGFSIAARLRLGGNWSGPVTVKKDHELIRSGPYALVRHPIYTGLLLAVIGSALFIGRWRALIALVPLIFALARKMKVEERFMAEEFGGAYARYREQVPALIPFVF